MFDSDDDHDIREAPPPPWAMHAYNRIQRENRSPTLEDYHRAGLVRINGEEYSEGEKPVLSPVIAVGLAGLALLWISRMKHPQI